MDWQQFPNMTQGEPDTPFTLEDMKERILPCVQAVYSEDVGTFVRGATALELLCAALLLEGLTVDEVGALVQEARRQVTGADDAH